MARYIDAEALLDRIPNPYERREVARWVDEQPTAPVMEVVLCEYCLKYDRSINGADGWCNDRDQRTYPDDYCSYGERKDG